MFYLGWSSSLKTIKCNISTRLTQHANAFFLRTPSIDPYFGFTYLQIIEKPIATTGGHSFRHVCNKSKIMYFTFWLKILSNVLVWMLPDQTPSIAWICLTRYFGFRHLLATVGYTSVRSGQPSTFQSLCTFFFSVQFKPLAVQWLKKWHCLQSCSRGEGGVLCIVQGIRHTHIHGWRILRLIRVFQHHWQSAGSGRQIASLRFSSPRRLSYRAGF